MSFVVAVIVSCEIGFWILLGSGLAARYLLRRPRLGMMLLASTPVVDVILLVATVADLRSGATAGFAHGLSALYLGYSIVYGHRLIAWADGWAAHRFDGTPRPARMYGREYTAHQWASVARTLLAVAIAAALLWLVGLAAVEPVRAEGLRPWFRVLGVLVVIDIVWAASYTVWPRKPAAVVGG